MDTFDSVKLVVDICKSRNIPISYLEKSCGFSNGYIKKTVKTFPADRAQKIADFLELPIDYIITGVLKDKEMFVTMYNNEEQEMILKYKTLSSDQKQIIINLLNQFYNPDLNIDVVKKQLRYDNRVYGLIEMFCDMEENDKKLILDISERIVKATKKEY